jgi:hypothetical protein
MNRGVVALIQQQEQVAFPSIWVWSETDRVPLLFAPVEKPLSLLRFCGKLDN